MLEIFSPLLLRDREEESGNTCSSSGAEEAFQDCAGGELSDGS